MVLNVLYVYAYSTAQEYLSSLVASRGSAGIVALCSVITDDSRLFSVGAGTSARLLLGCLTRRAVRVLRKRMVDQIEITSKFYSCSLKWYI